MKRSLKLPLLIALALASGHALALDLGQVQVKSALGQPLLAEIPVQQATPAELQKLSVQLASGDEFARAGVSAGRPDIPLHFEVVNGEGGHKVIRITSQAAVNDPFLDLLIEIHGATGKSVREFTILLDPPGSNPAPATASRQVAPSRAAAPAPAAPAPRATTPAHAAGGQVANGRFGPVERGQTLSAVARRTAPAGVDMNQMMLALRQANPDAFYRDNINALKAGAVLRVPTKAEAEAVAAAAAAAQVRQQNGDWRSGSAVRSPVSVADAGTRATTSSSPTTSAAPKGDHLALVPAAKHGAKAAAAGDAGAAANKQDLLRSQESLGSLQQQTEELKSRLKDLGDINNKNERLLALKDSEIAELQAKLAAARKAAGLPAEATSAPAPATAPAAAAAVAGSSAAPAAAASAAPATLAAAASAAAPAVAATAATAPVASQANAPAVASGAAKTTPVRPEVATPEHPAGGEPWYTQLWAQLLGGAVIVVLLLLALLGRRRGGKGRRDAAGPASSVADRFAASSAAGAGAAGTGTDEDLEQSHLLDQLAEHPDDAGLNLELVSLYYGRRDVEHFEAAAEAMHAHVTDPQQEEWQEVVRMGRDLTPAHPLFADHDADAAPTETAAAGSLDRDYFAAADAVAPVAPATALSPAADPVKVSEYNFNFDLTPTLEPAAPAAAVADAAPVAAAASAGSHAAEWHFDEPAAPAVDAPQDLEGFNDDPVDTKLDLARAYLDMGDPEGAKAMLEEVMQEGSQMQRDVAKRMLDDMH